MKPQAKRYSEEFQREALRRAETKPVTQVARELGVHAETIRGWRRRAKQRARRGTTAPSPEGGPPEGAELERELRRLQRENEILREEREILKKATAFFAKDAR